MNGFIKEIQEQPQALLDTLEFYIQQNEGQNLLQQASKFFRETLINHIVISGMGSSFSNGLILNYYLSSKGISCDVKDTGELLNYYSRPNMQTKLTTVYIFISQSGESGEFLRLFEKWGNFFEKSHLWAITNTPKSTLGRKAKLVFPTIGGQELSVTSKTYVTGILVNYLLAKAICGEKSPDIKDINLIRTISQSLKKQMKGDWKNWDIYQEGKKISHFLANPQLKFLNYIGTGPAMATVTQATLNYKEVTKIYAEGISLGMFRHGPIETIKKDFRAILLASDQLGTTEFLPVINNMIKKWGGGKFVFITPYSDLINNEEENLLVIDNPINNSYLAPIFEIIILQQHFCIVCEMNGFIPGEFLNTQKITK